MIMGKNAIWYILGFLVLIFVFFSERLKAFVSPALLDFGQGGDVKPDRPSYLGKEGYPVSMRNNNPGNIRVSSNPWKGKVTSQKLPNTDPRFEVFSDWVYGIRAMIKNLLTYRKRGLDTVRSIVSTWAPSSDGNETSSYIAYVANALGTDPDYVITFDRDTIYLLVSSMSEIESGRKNVVSRSHFDIAYSDV